jgi:hypothetical protein
MVRRRRHHHQELPGRAHRARVHGHVEAMLTEPLVINYYDEVFYSLGLAACRQGGPPGHS